jgi:hypothetical protein
MFNKKQKQIDDLTVTCRQLRRKIDYLELVTLGKTESLSEVDFVGVEKTVKLILEHLNLEAIPTEILQEVKVVGYILKDKEENNNE